MLSEIVAVNGVDISYLERKSESFINPGNTWNSREIFCTYYFIPAFFDWAGCGYQDGYTLQLRDENQEVQSIEVPLVSYAEYDATPAVFPESWSYLFDAEEGNRTEYIKALSIDQTYILTGGYTMSAAVCCINRMRSR